jgi:hypothetical protein
LSDVVTGSFGRGIVNFLVSRVEGTEVWMVIQGPPTDSPRGTQVVGGSPGPKEASMQRVVVEGAGAGET